MFYKMQIIYDEGRDVYILWNRWGRIGEQGAFQRTPYNTKEEAISEFRKIFKKKSGNVWEERDSKLLYIILEFEQKHGKYLLLKFKSTKASYSDFLKPFDLTVSPKSLLATEIYSIIS